MRKRMAPSFLILILMILFRAVSVQGQIIEWQKCYGGSLTEDGYSIAATQDGGYIMAGKASSGNGDVSGMHGYYDLWVLKVNGSGVKEWQKCLGGDGEESARCIRQTSDGGYIVAGFAQSNNGDVIGHHGGNYDAWVVKLSSTGQLEWQKCLGGSANEIAYSIVQTNEGGYIMAGYTKSTDGDVSGNHGWTDVWVVKLGSDGSLEWQKCYGGSDADEGWSVCLSPDGGFAVLGYTASSDSMVVGHHGNYDAWVLKITNTGELQWQKCIGGSMMENPFCIIPAAGGGYMICGEVGSNDGDVSGNHGSSDAWLVKMSSMGEIEWQKCFGGTSVDNFWDVKQGSNGTYTMAGLSYSNDGDVIGNHGSSDFWVVNVSSNGQLNWQKSLGGVMNENARGVILPSEGSAVVFGYSVSTNGQVSGNHGESDFWLVKLNQLTAVDEYLAGKENVRFFLNPEEESMKVFFRNQGYYSISIFSSDGKFLMEQAGTGSETILPLKQLPKGLFYVKARQEGHLYQNRFVH